MKRKDITKTFMMISNGEKPLNSMVYINFFSALRVKGLRVQLIICDTCVYLGIAEPDRFRKDFSGGTAL